MTLTVDISSRNKKYCRKYYENNKEKIYKKHYEWTARNRDKVNIRTLARRLADPINYLLGKARSRAKEKGLEFSLTKEDLNIPEICPVFGCKLVYDRTIKKGRDSASLDRFDNSKGYTKENTRVISLRANELKRDGSVEEFKKIIQYMEKSPAH